MVTTRSGKKPNPDNTNIAQSYIKKKENIENIENVTENTIISVPFISRSAWQINSSPESTYTYRINTKYH
jgi:hypothetical protein